MTAKLPAGLVVLILLLTAPMLPGQTQTGRRAAPSRRPPQAESDPGKVVPPVQGYVPPPEQSTPGTAPVFMIPSDPLDRAYWELYDRNRRVTLTGKVIRVDWSNPNSYIYLTAEAAVWVIESGFIQFRQSSVNPAIRVGETITVTGYLPKDEPDGELPARRSPVMAAYLRTDHLIRAGEIVTAFGQKLVMGQPPSEYELAQRLRCSAFGC